MDVVEMAGPVVGVVEMYKTPLYACW